MIPPLAQYTWSIPGLLADACAAGAIVLIVEAITLLPAVSREIRARGEAKQQHDGEGQ